MRNEKAIVKELLRLLRAEVGGFWWKVHGGIFQIKGNPDICGCVRGLYIAIEVKDGNNEADKIQLTRIKQIREAGGLAFVTWDARKAADKVVEYVKNHSTKTSEKSRKVIQKTKATRVIHGPRNWQNHDRFSSSKTKTTKKKKTL